MSQLSNKVVVVTGASAGIGRATAIAFAREGARLALVSRTRERLQPVVDEIAALGGVAQMFPADVADEGQCRAMIGSVESEFGQVDILVNNAGIGLMGAVIDLDPEDLKRVLDVNLCGLIWCTQAALPGMISRGGGQIINVSSVVGKRAMPFMSGYCLSKFAVQAFSESLRVEMKPHNIDVIVICPTRTATEFGDTTLMQKSGRRLDLNGMTSESVARIIVKASRRRQREVVISLGGKILALCNGLIPGIVDRGISIVWDRMAKPTER